MMKPPVLPRSESPERAASNPICFVAMLLALMVTLVMSVTNDVRAQVASGSAPAVAPDKNPVFVDFTNRVKTYVNLRSKLESSLPKPNGNSEADLLAHENALAAKVKEARKDAKPGDIFTAAAGREFHKQIDMLLNGKQGREVRKTISGEPVPLQVQVNQIYPRSIPYTTVPPTVLAQLPKLPMGMQYRIIRRTLALLDVKLHMIIDYIPDTLPSPAK